MHMHHQKHWDTPESLTKEALKALASMRLVTMLLSCTAEATHGVVWGEFLPTPHCALNICTFERLPIAAFAAEIQDEAIQGIDAVLRQSQCPETMRQ